VDISADLLGFIGAELDRREVPATLVRHDLREPLPAELLGGFEVAMTDPPYTEQGARLFLSRALSALPPRPGQHVYFSFGPKGPTASHQVLRTIVDLGLTAQAILRNFNDYLGAGVLGNTSHLYDLITTAAVAPAAQAEYTGPLYTADLRGAAREYQCVSCAERIAVGPGLTPASVGALKQAGCPRCAGTRFRPLQLISADEKADQKTDKEA
jgi:N4-bis(aminopropyl)spermidine synthase